MKPPTSLLNVVSSVATASPLQASVFHAPATKDAQTAMTVGISYVKRIDEGTNPSHAQMFSHDAGFLDL